MSVLKISFPHEAHSGRRQSCLPKLQMECGKTARRRKQNNLSLNIQSEGPRRKRSENASCLGPPWHLQAFRLRASLEGKGIPEEQERLECCWAARDRAEPSPQQGAGRAHVQLCFEAFREEVKRGPPCKTLAFVVLEPEAWRIW